jgi:hypothetical protein
MILRKFDQIYRFWKSAAHPGRQPGRAHHQGPWQAHPGAGDEHFQNKYEKMVSEDALRKLEMAITSSGRKHPCPRLQEDAGLAHEDPTVSYGGVGGGLLGLPARLTATLFAIFLWGEFELWVSAKSRNKTEDLILKIKEAVGSLIKNTVVKACKSLMSRIEAVITADGSFDN